MKRKAAILLVLFACCVAVGVCGKNLQTANERLTHRAESPVPGGDPAALWQAIWEGLAASSHAPEAAALPQAGASSPQRTSVRCPELLPFPQLARLAAHRPAFS